MGAGIFDKLLGGLSAFAVFFFQHPSLLEFLRTGAVEDRERA